MASDAASARLRVRREGFMLRRFPGGKPRA
jgi:hypothetical protein